MQFIAEHRITCYSTVTLKVTGTGRRLYMKKNRKFVYIGQIAGSMILGSLGAVVLSVAAGDGMPELSYLFMGCLFYGPFLCYPFFLTAYEVYLLVSRMYSRTRQKAEEMSGEAAVTRQPDPLFYDFYVMLLAFFYELLYLFLGKSISFRADWQEQLINAEMHTPIYTGSALTILVIACVALTGFLILKVSDASKTPPLVTVLAMAAVYLGGALLVIFTWHVYADWMDLYLVLVPLNYFLITARLILVKMDEYREDPERSSKIDSVPFLGAVNHLLKEAKRWPAAALLLMWPLLGILILILLLFGQAPDAVIKAFTETSDFRLSTQIAPPNVMVDEHYLCTVAAGGDKRIVHPIRRGIRHGHEVIVNRQLCIANAFEQILEERTPELHRRVRHFYDTYGFPIARMIRKRWIADLVYLLMKPLEWFFVIVLYLTEVHPEDRIALQYTGKGLQDFAG